MERTRTIVESVRKIVRSSAEGAAFACPGADAAIRWRTVQAATTNKTAAHRTTLMELVVPRWIAFQTSIRARLSASVYRRGLSVTVTAIVRPEVTRRAAPRVHRSALWRAKAAPPNVCSKASSVTVGPTAQGAKTKPTAKTDKVSSRTLRVTPYIVGSWFS